MFTFAGPLQPTLTWPRQLPIEGEPGAILVGEQREFCRGWPNQREVTVKGRHFVQEDAPDEIGQGHRRLVRRALRPEWPSRRTTGRTETREEMAPHPDRGFESLCD